MTEQQSVTIVDLEEQPVLVARFSASPEELGERLGEVLPRIALHAAQKGLSLAGMPFTRYLDHDLGEQTFTVAAGMPVDGSPEAIAAAEEGGVEATSLPHGPAARLVHFGPYEGLGEAHEALRDWVEASDREPEGAPWEVYVTDPGEEQDSSKWRTELYQPLAG